MISNKRVLRLRFPERDIPAWAARFPDAGSDDALLSRIRPLVLARGHLTRPEFLEICAWKSVRTKPRCRKNTAHRIETLTRAALATSDEALKINLLRLLDGVEWPTASTILHFCDARPTRSSTTGRSGRWATPSRPSTRWSSGLGI